MIYSKAYQQKSYEPFLNGQDIEARKEISPASYTSSCDNGRINRFRVGGGGRQISHYSGVASPYYSTFTDALNVGRACDEAGFYWIEDPYFIGGGTTENGHQRLRTFLSTPLLQGEKVAGIPGKMNMLLSGSTDFIWGNLYGDGVIGSYQ